MLFILLSNKFKIIKIHDDKKSKEKNFKINSAISGLWSCCCSVKLKNYLLSLLRAAHRWKSHPTPWHWCSSCHRKSNTKSKANKFIQKQTHPYTKCHQTFVPLSHNKGINMHKNILIPWSRQPAFQAPWQTTNTKLFSMNVWMLDRKDLSIKNASMNGWIKKIV